MLQGLKFRKGDEIAYPQFERDANFESIEDKDKVVNGDTVPNNSYYYIKDIVRLVDRDTKKVEFAYIYKNAENRGNFSYCCLAEKLEKEMLSVDEVREANTAIAASEYDVWTPKVGERYYTIYFDNEEDVWICFPACWNGTEDEIKKLKNGYVFESKDIAEEVANRANRDYKNLGALRTTGKFYSAFDGEKEDCND